jgi:hypothetical protein
MVVLTSSTESIILSSVDVSGQQYQWTSTFVNSDSTTHTPSSMYGTLNGISSAIIVPAPIGNSVTKLLKLTIVNTGNMDGESKLFKLVNNTKYQLFSDFYLGIGESVQYDNGKFQVIDSLGVKRKKPKIIYDRGWEIPWTYRVAAATQTGELTNFAGCNAAGQLWNVAATGPIPGSISGNILSGNIVWTDTRVSSVSSVYHYLPNAEKGTQSLINFECASPVGNPGTFLYDILLDCSGFIPSATTAQTMNTITLPPRDLNGQTSGFGVNWAFYNAGGALTNSALATITISYTNELGVAGRTTTTQIQTSYAANQMSMFRLKPGDRGIQSIQTITFSIPLLAAATGNLHVLALRKVGMVSSRSQGTLSTTLINNGNYLNPGVKLWPGTYLCMVSEAAGTGAATLYGKMQFEELL